MKTATRSYLSLAVVASLGLTACVYTAIDSDRSVGPAVTPEEDPAASASATPPACGGRAIGLAVGNVHGCAVLHDGTVACWGDNRYGQLGDGTRVSRGEPARVQGLSDVVALSASSFGTCARTNGGAVLCWGAARSDDRGDARLRPAEVAGVRGAKGLASGMNTVCALDDAGRVRCFDAHDRAVTEVELPREALSVAISLGDGLERVCADTAAAMYCWTPGSRGDLALTAGRPALSTALLATGFAHTCARTAEGVECEGANALGQLGNGGGPSPSSVAGLGEVSALAAGITHTCALQTDGAVRCWGANHRGQCGAASRSVVSTPHTVEGVRGARRIAVGPEHGCALDAAGDVLCWGANGQGQLGRPASVASPVARRVALPSAG